MSIIESVVDTVQSVMQEHNAARIGNVNVRIGSLRQVVPETLEFCFEAAIFGSPLEGARLVVTTVPATAHCGHCNQDFPVEENWFACPACGAADGKLRTGNELELTSIDAETLV
jgi:hydrogenase nickel incorporation protein HypA/HybF